MTAALCRPGQWRIHTASFSRWHKDWGATNRPQHDTITCVRRLSRSRAAENEVPATASSSSSSNHDNAAPASGTCLVRYRGTEFAAPGGMKLRTALLLAGVSPHNGRAQLINCRGLGTCGTCAVEVRGKVLPENWTAAEQLRLNFPPHKAPNNQRLRLACQVACADTQLEVIKRDKFWGQGSTVLGPAQQGEYSCPLGELEFLLDSSRRNSGQNVHKQPQQQHRDL